LASHRAVRIDEASDAFAERAYQTARRKAIYVELHPETKQGNPGVSRQVGDTRERAESDRFTANTAKATGKSERAEPEHQAERIKYRRSSSNK
jgi:hypothetical protein